MARVAGIILLLILLFSGISVYGTGESSSSSANFGIFDGYNSGLYQGLPNTGLSIQGQTRIQVECQDIPLAVETSDLSFGSILSTNYKNIKKEGARSVLSGVEGFVITDVKGACHSDVDNDGDFWDISIAFSNMYEENSDLSLILGSKVGYGTGTQVKTRLELTSEAGNSSESRHLMQVLGPQVATIEAVGLEQAHTYDGYSTTVLRRIKEGDIGAIGVLQYTPDVAIELPPYVPIGNYEGTIDVFISEG